MKHFDITEWVDRARGVGQPEDLARMDAHLRTGCTRCRAAFNFVQRVVVVSRSADYEEPPSDVVRWATAIAALQRPPKASALTLIGSLISDSLRTPLMAGMRGDEQETGHLLYEAGNFYLDLRFEREPDSVRETLIGQVADREAPVGQLTDAPVLLTTRNEIVAHAVCNSFGEFQMDFPPTPRLRLRIAIDPSGGRIELPITPPKR